MDKLAIVFCLIFASVHCAVVPSGIITCKKSSKDYNKCIRAAVRDSIKNFSKGNKELGFLSVDPLSIPKIHIAGNGGKVDLEQTYTNVNIYGLSNTDGYSDVRIDIDGNNCNIDLEYPLPKIEFIGHIQVKGKLLLFNLGGHGPANITLINTKLRLGLKCEKVAKNGGTFLNIVKTTLDLNPEKCVYDIKNLIDGKPELSANVLAVMNDNNLEIFRELKRDYESALSSVIQSLAISFFMKLPVESVFLS